MKWILDFAHSGIKCQNVLHHWCRGLPNSWIKYTHSVARFGEILPLWQNFKSLWAIFVMVSIWQTFVPALGNIYATGQIFIVVNGQRLKNNLAIWSHWTYTTLNAIFVWPIATNFYLFAFFIHLFIFRSRANLFFFIFFNFFSTASSQ